MRCLTIQLGAQSLNQHHRAFCFLSICSPAKKNGANYFCWKCSVALIWCSVIAKRRVDGATQVPLSWALQIRVINKKKHPPTTSNSPVWERKKCTQGCLRHQIFARGINEINYLMLPEIERSRLLSGNHQRCECAGCLSPRVAGNSSRPSTVSIMIMMMGVFTQEQPPQHQPIAQTACGATLHTYNILFLCARHEAWAATFFMSATWRM